MIQLNNTYVILRVLTITIHEMAAVVRGVSYLGHLSSTIMSLGQVHPPQKHAFSPSDLRQLEHPEQAK